MVLIATMVRFASNSAQSSDCPSTRSLIALNNRGHALWRMDFCLSAAEPVAVHAATRGVIFAAGIETSRRSGMASASSLIGSFMSVLPDSFEARETRSVLRATELIGEVDYSTDDVVVRRQPVLACEQPTLLVGEAGANGDHGSLERAVEHSYLESTHPPVVDQLVVLLVRALGVASFILGLLVEVDLQVVEPDDQSLGVSQRLALEEEPLPPRRATVL